MPALIKNIVINYFIIEGGHILFNRGIRKLKFRKTFRQQFYVEWLLMKLWFFTLRGYEICETNEHTEQYIYCCN